MKLTLSVGILLTFWSFAAFAQKNFKPGYMINTKGDTLRGFIDQKEWNLTPKTVLFKTSLSAEASVFSPTDISYVNINNTDEFERYNGIITDDQTNSSGIRSARVTRTRAATIFLKVEERGNVANLYSYIDDFKDHYFVKTQTDSLPIELIFRTYYEGSKLKNEDAYMQQLYLLAQKQQANLSIIRTEIERSDYKLADMRKIVRLINRNSVGNNGPAISGTNITERQIKNKQPKVKGSVFYMGAGVNLIMNKVEWSSTTTVSSGDGMTTIFPSSVTYSQTSVFPTATVGVNILSNPNVGRLVFKPEINLSGNKVNGTQEFYSGTLEFGFTQYTASLAPQLLYNFYNTESLKIYGDAGISVNFSASTDAKSVFKDKTTSETQENKLDMSKTWTSFMFKAGAIVSRNLDIYVAYYPSATYTSNNAYSFSASNLRFGINYLFW